MKLLENAAEQGRGMRDKPSICRRLEQEPPARRVPDSAPKSHEVER